MMIKLLPLFFGLVHIWNPYDTPIAVAYGNGYAFVAPKTEITVEVTDGPIQAQSGVRVWTEFDGSTFEAIEPKQDWKLPVREGTGIALVNANGPTRITFTLRARSQDYEIVGTMNTGRMTIFVSQLMRTTESGTLTIHAEAPIAVAAANCKERCVASIAVGGF